MLFAFLRSALQLSSRLRWNRKPPPPPSRRRLKVKPRLVREEEGVRGGGGAETRMKMKDGRVSGEEEGSKASRRAA